MNQSQQHRVTLIGFLCQEEDKSRVLQYCTLADE